MDVNQEAALPILETDKGDTDKEQKGKGRGKARGKLLTWIQLLLFMNNANNVNYCSL